MVPTGTDAVIPLTMTLSQWLSRWPPPRDGHLVLGGTGHLLMTPTEAARVSERLRHDVLPTLLSDDVRHVSLITSLAPGADLLVNRLVGDWLIEIAIEHDITALLPVPIEVLVEDWLAKTREESRPVDPTELAEIRSELAAMLARCDATVDLLPPATTAHQLTQPDFRQSQYRRLAACLAEQTDVLIALLRLPGNAIDRNSHGSAQPGGTAEVVEWRRDPARIPAHFSTLARRAKRAVEHRLIVVDPAADPGPAALRNHDLVGTGPDATTDVPSLRPEHDSAVAEVLDACRRSLRSGNYLQAYDQACSGLGRGLQARSLDYLCLLALANAGSTRLALDRLRRLGLTGEEVDEDWLALEGRLLKDLALAGGGDAADLFHRSGEAYHAAYRRTGGYFTAINAATMLLLSGKPEIAMVLARAALTAIAASSASDESDAYYRCVTEAEAALLLGDTSRCRDSLRRADGLLRGNLNVRSRTAKQLRLICRYRHVAEGDLLDALTVAPVIHLERTAPPAEHRFLIAEPDPPFGVDTAPAASFVFAAIAEPCDLSGIERLLDREARLHLVLPAARPELLDRWQRRHGSEEARRLGRCLDRSDEITVARGFLEDEERWCADYVSAMALGLSRLAAQRLGARWQSLNFLASQLRIPSSEISLEFSRSVPPAVQPRTDSRKLTPEAIPRRRFVGTLFADFVGYSRLSDDEMPQFQTLLLGSIATRLATWRDQILLQHTWGDAVHVVTVDADSAAEIATAIQDVVASVRPRSTGNLSQLELRLAVHYAPVYQDVDPVEGTPTFFGSQLSFTARIEPVTPPGMIFVTEAFAARLALTAPERFVVEYAGEIDLAKRFGKYRLYSLRRAPPATP